MNVVFLGRNFSDKLPVPVPVVVDKYSHNMIGGPERATLSAPVTVDKWDLMKLLRAPVEIYGDDGGIKWWGFVGRITVPHNNQMIGLGLDEMYNDISIDYNGGSTNNTDPQSIDLFGTKQYKIVSPYSTSDAATNIMNVYLEDHKFPVRELEMAGPRDLVNIECYGWFSTLGWKYYSVASSTSNVDNATQVSAIVTSAGQFINGVVLEDLAGVTSAQERDGKSTALTYVNELLSAGTTNILPLLATVDRNRIMRVYEQPAEPNAERLYILDDDNRLRTKVGAMVPDQDCVVARWVRMKDVPNVIGGYASMRPFFIARSEYDRPKDKTRYEPAGGYEQRRLAKYIENPGGGGGGGNPPYIPKVPEDSTAGQLHVLQVSGGSSTDLGAGNSDYIHPTSIVGAYANYHNVYLSSGTVAGGARSGWVAGQTGRYLVIANFFVNSGSSAPTDGFITGFLYTTRTDSGVTTYFAQQSFTVPTGGFTSDLTGLSVVGTTTINTNGRTEGFEFKLGNYSDGDIVWSNLVVTFIYLGS